MHVGWQTWGRIKRRGFLVNNTAASLFEDNIVSRMFPVIEVNEGSCGNVFAYNLFEDSTVFGVLGANGIPTITRTTPLTFTKATSRGTLKRTDISGSVSEDTIFRNWITGTIHDQSKQGFIIALKRFTRNYSIVGNILGNSAGAPGTPYTFGEPNIGNSEYTGTAQPTKGDFWKDWAAMQNASPGSDRDQVHFKNWTWMCSQPQS